MIKEGMAFTPPANATHQHIATAEGADMRREVSGSVTKTKPSLGERRQASEAFATGTMGEITPVKEINGRKRSSRSSSDGPQEIFSHFHKLIPQHSEK